MSSYTSHLEKAIFQSMLPQLEADGFSVFVHPSKDMLPLFLSTYHPDAIAYKGDRKIAIEIMRQFPGNDQKVRRIREIFSEHPEWELRLVYAPPKQVDEVISPSSRDLIDEHLQRIEGSFESMGTTAALLVAWATFEAAARRLIPTNLGRPQSPSRLIEVLASEGYITSDEADKLRDLSQVRNEIAHGRLELIATREQVESLIAITRTVLTLDS